MQRRQPGAYRTYTVFPYTTLFRSDQGGPEVFVHIKAFKGLRERPQERQRVRFRAATEPGGKPRAYHAELIDPAGRAMRRPATLKGTASVFRSEEHTSDLQSLMRHTYAVFCLTKTTNTTQ